MWYRSRRFNCILLVFFRRWGWLVMRDLIKHDALLWLVVFQQLWLVHFDPFLFHSVICSLGGPLSHGSPIVVFFDCRHPRFWNFYSTIPVNIIRVNSYINYLFDSALAVIRLAINKLYFVPEWLVSGVVACSETAEVSVRASRMSRSCSLIPSCIGLPVSPMYTLPHSQEIL